VQPSSTWSQLAALAEPTRVASVAVPELERATTLAHVACRLHVDGARDPRLTGPDTRAALRAARGYAATIVRISPSALADAAPRLGHPGVHATTSATALEAYVACPFRFLAERVLELSGPERASEELDPAARGSLRHHVAAAVLVHLQRLGLLPLRGGEAAPRESAEALVAARLALQEWKDERGLPDASRWSAECALALADLPRFLEGERRAAREGWDPERFEWAFTGDHTLDLVGEGGRRLSIAGRIDRIDLRGPKARREALVIDYKTAARPIDGNALGKSELQLPIYARVVRECLAIPIVDASYVSLRDGSRSPKSMSQVLEDAPPAATDAALEATLWRVLDGVAAGEFDPRPLDPSRTCVGCPHGALCRIDRGDDLEAAREG
jgi:ATP-dependent helicase/DNAse subunit B